MTVPVSPATVPLSTCAAMATPELLASVTEASVHVVVERDGKSAVVPSSERRAFVRLLPFT